ncbi:MAG: DUF2288 domain-containing protein [Gammaproteobacteria bacterium]|nr:DUF2288 domain-containing protein [Gammaproteobacteria bacterium]
MNDPENKPPAEGQLAESTDPAELRARLNTETARIEWQALAPHFARGVVVVVSPELDLVEVAAAFVENDKASVSEWMESDKLERASDDDARGWSESDKELWAVVVAPWVLVQDRA